MTVLLGVFAALVVVAILALNFIAIASGPDNRRIF